MAAKNSHVVGSRVRWLKLLGVATAGVLVAATLVATESMVTPDLAAAVGEDPTIPEQEFELDPWQITLTSSATSFEAGESVEFTAESDRSLDGTGYSIHIWDRTAATKIAYCTTGTTCTVSLIPFTDGPAHTYEAEIGAGPSYANPPSDIQATSNTVEISHEPWTLSLTTSATVFEVGESVTLTATANQNVAGTPFMIRLFDVTTASLVAYCTTGTTCEFTSAALFTLGPANQYVAEVSAGAWYTPMAQTVFKQAVSNQVSVDRAAWTVDLEASSSTFTAGQPVTLTATVNQDVSGTPFMIRIFDVTSPAVIAYCTTGTTCAFTSSTLILNGPAHDFVAEVSAGAWYTPLAQTVEKQALSNQVALDRAAWSVTLSADELSPAVGQPVTLTATANQNLGDTSGHYVLRIWDTTTGAMVKKCTTGTTCEYTAANLFTSGPAHDYVAEISDPNIWVAQYGTSVDIQATSNVVTIERQPWVVTLESSHTNFETGEAVTLTATANQDAGTYWIRIWDTTTGQVLKYCNTGQVCQVTSYQLFFTGDAHQYIAEIGGGNWMVSQYGTTPDVQTVSNTVEIERAAWTVTFYVTSDLRPDGLVDMTFRAETNQDAGLTAQNYWLTVVDVVTEEIFFDCNNSGPVCVRTGTWAPDDFPHDVLMAAVSAERWYDFHYVDVQALSTGYVTDFGLGPDPSETIGGSNPSAKQCSCAHADPVNAATGVFFLPINDLAIPGAGPRVGSGRTYSAAANAIDGPFGYGWSPDFDVSLRTLVSGDARDPRPRRVEVTQDNGSTVRFNQGVDGNYHAPSRIRASLTLNPLGDAWTFTHADGSTDLFDESGRALSASDVSGNTVDYSYSPGGELSTITGSGGRSITFTWSSGRITQATDSAGRVVSYQYAAGNLVEVTGADGESTSYSYDSAHRMTQIETPNGGTTTNVYDGQGRVTTQTDPIGRITTFGYTGTYNSGTTTITSPGGLQVTEAYQHGRLMSRTVAPGTPVAATTSFTYDRADNLITFTDALGNTSTSTYDGSGNELTSVDPLGRETFREFDSRGNVLALTDPANRETSYTYGAAGRMLSSTSPGGKTSTWTYHPDGTVATMTAPGGAVTSYSYDAAGRPTSLTDPAGRTSSVEYDLAGRPIAQIAVDLSQTTRSFDDAGRVLTSTDQLDHTTTRTYDDDGNLVSVELPGGETTTYGYDLAGQLLSTTAPGGATTTFTYTPFGAVATVTDPLDRVSSYDYDAAGRLDTLTDPLGNETEYSYDLAGRTLTTTTPTGGVTTAEYDDAGQVVSSTDPLGNESTFVYDLLGRLVSTTDAIGRETEQTYTADDDLAEVTYPGGSTEQYSYDTAGQLTGFENADGKTTTYVYDAAGQLQSKTEPGGRVTSVTYDGLGRVATTTRPDASAVTYAYDDASRVTAIDYPGTASDVAFGYDSNGRVTTLTDGTGVTTTTYAPAGRVSSVTDGAGQALGYAHDDAGQLTELTYPGSHAVEYDYDDAGRMTAFTDWDDNTTTFGWTDDGQLASIDYPNDVTESRDYDDAGRLLEIATTAPTAASISEYLYDYDDASQLIETTSTDALAANKVDTFGFDGRGQIQSVAPSNSYTISPAGLVTASPDGAALTYGTGEQLQSLVDGAATTTFQYDGNGSRTQQSTITPTVPLITTFGWTAAGGLAAVDTPTASIAYTLDGAGLRQTRTEGVTTRDFLWDTTSALPLLLDDGEHSYLYGPLTTPIAQIDHSTGDIEYLHTDLLGSVRGITNDTGGVVSTTAFDHYGTRTAHAGTTDSEFGFTGAWTDPDTALIYLRARDYDPVSMQFLRVDPAIDSTRQPYAYANNAPTQLTDPTGLDVWSDLGSIAGAIGTEVLAAGAGFLDDTTGGASSLLLGAVIPGYDCFVQEHSVAFEAGRAASTVVSIAMLVIPGVGLAAAAIKIGLKYGLRAVVKVATAAIRTQVKGVVASVRSASGAARGAANSIGARLKSINWSDDTGEVSLSLFVGAGRTADAARAAGRTSGAASELRVGPRSFTDVSSGGSSRALNPQVVDALEAVPDSARAPWHGACSEMGCISQALDAGVNPAGGTVRTVAIGNSNPGHGLPKRACSSCAVVLDAFGVRY